MTADHRCPVDECRVKKGCPCPHVMARCRNCRGQHLSRASLPGEGGGPAERQGMEVAPSPTQAARQKPAAPTSSDSSGTDGVMVWTQLP